MNFLIFCTFSNILILFCWYNEKCQKITFFSNCVQFSCIVLVRCTICVEKRYMFVYYIIYKHTVTQSDTLCIFNYFFDWFQRVGKIINWKNFHWNLRRVKKYENAVLITWKICYRNNNIEHYSQQSHLWRFTDLKFNLVTGTFPKPFNTTGFWEFIKITGIIRWSSTGYLYQSNEKICS